MSRLATSIAVTSGKGGVGKTSLAANLAFAMGAVGRRVLLLDADYGLANLDVLFGICPVKTLSDFFAGDRPLRDILIQGPCGVRLLPSSSGLSQLADLEPRYAQRLLQELQELRSEFDVILIDTATGIGRPVIQLLRIAGRVVVVTCPEPTAIVDAYALIKVVATEDRDKRADLIVNRARGPEQGQHVHNQLDQACRSFLDRPIGYLGAIPEDASLPRSVRRQRALLQDEPRSPAGQAIGRIALALDHGLGSGRPEGTNLVNFWENVFSVGSERCVNHE